ncbi:MAG TPA: hypothetical protein DIU00_22645 [Phycisphaerales bacterium]|nr:hypothetical protein [Phycisphaerales bacterium]
MIGTDSNHCRIVAESLAGKREVNEQTFASLAILDERLEHLRKLDESYSGVTFSPDAAKLLSQKNAVTVG